MNDIYIRRKLISKTIDVVFNREEIGAYCDVDLFEEALVESVLGRLPDSLSWTVRRKTIKEIIGRAVQDAFEETTMKLKKETVRAISDTVNDAGMVGS
jgi:hypothetical protein